MGDRRHRELVLFGGFFLALLSAGLLSAQTAEISSQDTPVVFKSTSNLIPVPVVVRDSQGQAVGNLGIDDFQLFDDGKPQLISRFTVEKTEKSVEIPASGNARKNNAPAAVNTATQPEAAPDRFVAYLFDDLHMSESDLVHTRDAAIRQIESAQHSAERAAIYTTSGRQAQEFTSDRQKLRTVLTAIGVGAAMIAKSSGQSSCPQMDFYMGDRIYNKHEAALLKLAAKDAIDCLNLNIPRTANISDTAIQNCDRINQSNPICTAIGAANRAARLAVEVGDRDTEASLNVLRAVVTRMSAMPGQRTIVLISSGFLVLDARREEEMGLIDRAIKANVVIGGLDARGLYTQIAGGDASDRVGNAQTGAGKLSYQGAETMAQTDVVANLANGTGGTFYQGTNDFDEGFARVAATPDYIYILGFSPQDLKLDGRFHSLKVTLKNRKGLDLQVRNGYFAANYAVGPAEQSKEQIEEAFFSREEIHDLPSVLQTQYFKLDNGDATLSAVTKIDAKKLKFRKEGDRNRNDVTVVTGIFDSDGNYITGAQKVLEMKFLDQTLQTRLGNGLSVEHSFTVHPGRYTVRVVVRDTEGQTMSAQSSLVEIPQ